MPIIEWLLREHLPECPINGQWADLSNLPAVPRKLPGRIEKCLEFYSCNIIFIHRDAEKESHQKRVEEIKAALSEAERRIEIPLAICVVPVRMQEAWLLIDEQAIRRAADNPNGRQQLSLPPLKRLEDLPDPKKELRRLLEDASESTGRRLRSYQRRLSQKAYRVSQLINDFSPLRRLPAFQHLEREVREIAEEFNL